MHAHNPTTRQTSPRRALALALCGVLACALSCWPAQATPPPSPSVSPWLKIPTPPPTPPKTSPPPPPTWTIDPGPALNPDAQTPLTLWFNDGQRVLVSRGPYDSRSLWTLDTPTGTWTKLTDHYEDADVSPDALRVAVASPTQLQILSWSPTLSGAVERVIPWPGYIDHARRIVTWLDDHTLLRIQQHDTDDPDDPDGGSYGWYSYRCEVVDLRADPPSVTPQPCPEGGFSYIGDVASDASQRLLISSSAEGCIDLSAILYAPNKPQQPLALPPLNLYPAGDFTLGFTHSKDILLLSPCDLDHPNPTTGCNPERDPAPWHLFLWSSAFAQPKRLYSDLPPYAIPDAAARHIAWSVPGGVCVATLDPPSPRQCWPF